MAEKRTYTTTQVATAATELREAAGAEPEEFSLEQVILMLGDEIRLLRERGFTDQHIAELFSSFDIQATAEEIAACCEDSTVGGGD